MQLYSYKFRFHEQMNGFVVFCKVYLVNGVGNVGVRGYIRVTFQESPWLETRII